MKSNIFIFAYSPFSTHNTKIVFSLYKKSILQKLYILANLKKMSAIIVGVAVFVIILIIILVIFLSKKDTPDEKLPKLSSKRVVFED